MASRCLPSKSTHSNTRPGACRARCGRHAAPSAAGRVKAVASTPNDLDSGAQSEPSLVGLDRRQLFLAGLVGPAVTALFPAEALAGGVTKVFVAGATGNTGRRVVQQLRSAGVDVVAGVRSTTKANSLGFGADKGITVVEADLTSTDPAVSAALASALAGVDAVVCATGAAGFGKNSPKNVDNEGTQRLVRASLAAGVPKFVLVSSLLTNAAAIGQKDNPNFKFLNLFGGVLDEKLKAEKFIKSSGVDYTIVRPGGLSNDPPAKVGNLIISGEDTLFGLDTDPGREISRDTVAAVCVQAVLQAAASNKVVEIVSSPTAPVLSPEQWFASV